MSHISYKKKIRKSTKQIYTIIVIILLLFSTSSLFFTFINSNTFNYSEKATAYQHIFKQEYSINLFENEYISTTIRPMNEMYMTELIENMQAVFKYNFKTTEETDVKYTYSLKGVLIGTYDTGETSQKILEQEYGVIAETTDQLTTNNVEILEDVTINLKEYNDIVVSFQNQFGIIIDAKLQVIFHVTIEAIIDGETIIEEYANNMSATIRKKGNFCNRSIGR